ncbi:MAG: nuclear transport factor 2 family protein [Candidatus Omnitrophota bacterium]|nr:nuclear transport factor 2 family protein [Candidatus Omnitrophota bacterium]
MIKRLTLLLIFTLAIASFCFTNPARAENESNDAVKAAADQFYVALNAMFTGDAAPMAALWLHADDVTYMGPDGTFEVGWENVKAVWEKQAAKKMGGQVKADRMQINSGHHMGITYNYEIGENTDADGNPVKVSIRATNVFHKNDEGEWKMIGHHTDILPFLDESIKNQ